MSNQLVVLAISRALQMIIGVVSLNQLARLLGPAELGRFGVLNSSALLYIGILIAPVGNYLNRMLWEWRGSGSLRRAMAHFIGYWFLVAAGVALATLAVARYTSVYRGYDAVHLSMLLAAFVLVNTISGAVPAAMNILGQYVAYAVLIVATQAGCLVASVALALVYHRSAEIW
ncbi:MAG TPA: hypothetical protein VJP78_14305, partial [Thermoleophilia bacterium]|nr:hypothetical protein [Thermoleophilia bacterium]